MRTIRFKICDKDGCWYEELEPRVVKWYRLNGTLVAIGEPGTRLVGGDMWGYHVWGSKSYSLIAGEGVYPLVALDEPPSDVKREGAWIALAFGGRAPKPWAPISIFVKGVRTPARKGVLVAVP